MDARPWKVRLAGCGGGPIAVVILIPVLLGIGIAQQAQQPVVNDFWRYDTRVTTSTVQPVTAAPVVTQHEIEIQGKRLAYTAYTGMMPIRNATTGVTEGNMFYVYYAEDGIADEANRPLFILFNGGPGSSTVWLHMGAFGPVKVHLEPNGAAGPPPYHYESNPNTLLDQADLVFVDCVGTGYSRPALPKWGPKFWGIENDVAAMGEFIRLFLSRYQRWGSPKFIGGESYGTLRAAALSGYLAERGIALNGVFLLSTIINEASGQGDLNYVNFFPTIAMSAWYHKRLAPNLEALSAAQMAHRAEEFASHEYLEALYQGTRLSAAQRDKVIDDFANLTGFSKTFIADNDLRISLDRFRTELLRNEGLIVGRLDTRFTSYATDQGANRAPFDPSEASIRLSFTPVINDYLRRQLGYKSDDIYYILGGGIGPWSGTRVVTPALEEAFARNPAMHLFVAMGYYDDARTAYYAVEWTLAHLHVSPQVRQNNIMTDHFEAGHMVYIDSKAVVQLRADMRTFIQHSIH